MKYFLFMLLSFPLLSAIYSHNKINYLEPGHASNYVSINSNIIIGFEKEIFLGENEILNSLSVKGTLSGLHTGRIILCEGNRKIIFKPSTSFSFLEDVSVVLKNKLVRLLFSEQKEYKYTFRTSSCKIRVDLSKIMNEVINPEPDLFEKGPLVDPPPLYVTINNNPSDGYLFTAPFNGTGNLVISTKNGIRYWSAWNRMVLGDFKKQPDGNITYFEGVKFKHFEMNRTYDIVDSFYCGNGYETDIHDLRVLSNRHALLMAYDPEIVDMSQIIPGGNPHATVYGLIIQEIDADKNVVFQWRSWDHFAITDALHENLLDSVIDYVHGNSIEPDNDGNIIISSRHLDEITKINRTTGNIIWRFGGLNNQFTFTNDTLRFTYQHAARRISNGNITIFDNGNWHIPHFSRAVEYSLDEINKTATVVWQYRHNPDVYGWWGGYVQRLENGNTLISWGGTTPTLTEVRPDGTTAFEASYQHNIFTYRAYKFNWEGAPLPVYSRNELTPEKYKLYQNYPNPFNPVTIIKYNIPKTSYVELTVFDITGKELKKIVSDYIKPGSYSTVFDGARYSSGIYICRLRAGDFNASQKMILLK
jgi:hypothetical protein